MRIKDLKIDASKNRLELDIINNRNNFTIVVADRKAKLIQLPSHGETKIITHQGRVKRIRFDEGEEF
ncbi:XtrA/YqaO family protein [Bacillus sp. FSL R5-0523]|uniref:XtrA/YqaO family protein n=1 Tax=Bacillus sp. FSL R5-0523 TaxID=2975304 RepID=UPI0030D6E106